jgi:hypothetical protein
VQAGCKRGNAEDGEIELIGIAAPHSVAEIAREARADQHPEEGRRDEDRALLRRRKALLQHGGDNAARQINVKCVERRTGGNQPENAPMQAGDRQSVQTRTGIYGLSCVQSFLPCPVACHAVWGRFYLSLVTYAVSTFR